MKDGLVDNHILILNIDDTERPYKEMFDPNIREIYGSQSLPQQVWHPEQMSSEELWRSCKFIDEEEKLFEYTKDRYNFMAWTHLKLDADADEGALVKALEDRFVSSGSTLSHPD